LAEVKAIQNQPNRKSGSKTLLKSNDKLMKPMKIFGLIGGTTWLSTTNYYCIINQEVNRHPGE